MHPTDEEEVRGLRVREYEPIRSHLRRERHRNSEEGRMRHRHRDIGANAASHLQQEDHG